MGAPKLYTLFGKTQTITQWAAEYKVNRRTLYERLYEGMDIRTALFTPTDRHTRVTIWDETRTIPEWSKAAGITRSGFYSRRKRGWKGEELAVPNTQGRGLTAFDKTQSYAAWERERGIPKQTLYYRVKRAGMKPELALTLPIDKTRSRHSERE